MRIAQIVGGARPGRSSKASEPVLHVKIAPPQAKVMLLPGRFRSADYIRTHISYVVKMSAEKGEAHIKRNLAVIGDRLRDIGVGDDVVADELRTIEGRVRAELWRQILLPDVTA